VHNSRNVHRGPLVYSLPIEADKRVVGQPAKGFDEYEQTPTSAWNYALAVPGKDPRDSVELIHAIGPDRAADANPFTPENTPVKLTLTARKLPAWGLAWNGVVAFDPPLGPVRSDEPTERVTLVPFGATELRVTNFPVLGEAGAGATSEVAIFNFDDSQTAGWSWFGGGWAARDGKLRTSATDGTPGFKALIEDRVYADFQMEADVMPPPVGDAGVIVRVSKASIGADAYEGYYAGISVSGQQVILGRAEGASWTPLKVVGRPILADRSTKLSVTVRGNRIEVRVNGVQAIALTDDRWKSGQVGVRMYTRDKDRAASAFDNVQVTPAVVTQGR